MQPATLTCSRTGIDQWLQCQNNGFNVNGSNAKAMVPTKGVFEGDLMQPATLTWPQSAHWNKSMAPVPN